MSKTLQFQTIKFNIISIKYSSTWPRDSILSGATTLSQNKPGSDGKEGVLRIPQSSSITWTSPSDSLVSYQDTRYEGVIPLCKDAVGVFCRHSWLGSTQS